MHIYVKPDAFKSNPQNNKLSNQRFWKVEGILSQGFVSKLKLYYDGNKSQTTNGYMDTLLTIVNGDSIRLFYRANANDDWKIITPFKKVSSGLRNGSIEIDTLKLGEYTFGNSTDTTSVFAIGIYKNLKNKIAAILFPNPTKQKCTLLFDKQPETLYKLMIYNTEGKIVQSQKTNQKSTQINISELRKGIYTFNILEKNKILFSRKLVID